MSRSITLDRAGESKLRRDDLRKEGYCINGKHHGPPTHGTRCDWCAVVPKVGGEVARWRAGRDPKHPQPPRRPR